MGQGDGAESLNNLGLSFAELILVERTFQLSSGEVTDLIPETGLPYQPVKSVFLSSFCSRNRLTVWSEHGTHRTH